MRTSLIKITRYLLLITLSFQFTGCKEDENNDTEFEQEKRYFNLFVRSNYPDLLHTASGLYIDTVENGSGLSVEDGDWLLINYVMTSIPSDRIGRKVLDTSFETVAEQHGVYVSDALYGPVKFKHGEEIPGGIREGMSLSREGGKYRFMFTSDLGFGSEGSKFVNPFVSVIYDTEILKVIKDIESYEASKLQSYLDTIPGDAITEIYDEETDATMYYIEDSIGTGSALGIDSAVQVQYSGYLCDERVVDSNFGGDPFDLVIGEETVIRGWNLGLTRFNRGGRGRLVIPYPLAYGELGTLHSSGKQIIPPYETLIFEMKVLDEGEGDDGIKDDLALP
jgi:FKBP-type peptidyl-prolyl cis-trans isomerase